MKRRIIYQANARWMVYPQRGGSSIKPHWKIYLGNQNVGRMDAWQKMDDRLFETVRVISTIYFRKLISYE